MSRRRQLKRESTVDEKEVATLVQRNIQRRADPTHFTDGSLLEKLAVEHCEAFRKLFHGKRNVSPPREISIGSACTGSASEVAAAFFFQQAVNAVSDSGFRSRPVFSCDINEEKRKWIEGVHHAFAPHNDDVQDSGHKC